MPSKCHWDKRPNGKDKTSMLSRSEIGSTVSDNTHLNLFLFPQKINSSVKAEISFCSTSLSSLWTGNMVRIISTILLFAVIKKFGACTVKSPSSALYNAKSSLFLEVSEMKRRLTSSKVGKPPTNRRHTSLHLKQNSIVIICIAAD